MMCWADTLASLVQTLCTTSSSRNQPCFPRINATGKLGTDWGAGEHLSLLSSSFSHHQHQLGCRDALTAAGSPRGTPAQQCQPEAGNMSPTTTSGCPSPAAPTCLGSATVPQPG